jgi:hypothetical protein
MNVSSYIKKKLKNLPMFISFSLVKRVLMLWASIRKCYYYTVSEYIIYCGKNDSHSQKEKEKENNFSCLKMTRCYQVYWKDVTDSWDFIL